MHVCKCIVVSWFLSSSLSKAALALITRFQLQNRQFTLVPTDKFDFIVRIITLGQSKLLVVLLFGVYFKMVQSLFPNLGLIYMQPKLYYSGGNGVITQAIQYVCTIFYFARHNSVSINQSRFTHKPVVFDPNNLHNAILIIGSNLNRWVAATDILSF